MSLDMTPVVRAQWCAALRSGGYQRTTGQLRRDGAYCCLGVLTDLAIKSGDPATAGIRWEDGPDEEDGLSIEGELPDAVREWAGLADNDPVLDPGKPGVLWHTAAWHNDGDATFAEIADLIDGGAS